MIAGRIFLKGKYKFFMGIHIKVLLPCPVQAPSD